MKIKTEYVLLAIVIAALSIYLFVRKQDRTTYQLPLMAAVQRSDITRLEITRKGETIELRREGSDWKISPQSYAADAARVKDILDVVCDLTLTAVVSEAEQYRPYDLDETSRVRVKAWSGEDVLREFDTGKTAASFQHTYVKLPGNPEVYHARGNFRRTFDLSVDDMRDKTVLSFQPETLSEIVLQKGDRVTAFRQARETAQEAGQSAPAKEKEGSAPASAAKWVNESGESADEGVVRQWVAALAGLKCDGYLEGGDRDRLGEPIFRAVLKGETEHSLSIFAKLEENADRHPAASSDNSYIFFLPNRRVENLMKDPADFLQKKTAE